MEYEISCIFQVKLVTKTAVLGSTGIHFMKVISTFLTSKNRFVKLFSNNVRYKKINVKN